MVNGMSWPQLPFEPVELHDALSESSGATTELTCGREWISLRELQ